MSTITLQQMRVLAAVLEHRSFTRGAHALFMTQSAASQHVRALEQALGTRLVERVGGDVLPTRAGEGLARYAREILRAAADAERFVASVRDGHAGRLDLGACGSAVYLVPGLVAAFRGAHAGVEVGLRVASREDVRESVASGTVDVALMSGPLADTRLTVQTLCTDQLVLVASPTSALLPAAALAPVPLERIAAQPVVAPSQSTPSWQLVQRWAESHGVHLRPVLRLDGTEAMKKAVEAGLGVAFLSCWVVEHELALGTLRLVPVDVPVPRRRFFLVRHAVRQTDAVLHAFLGFAPEFLARRHPASYGVPDGAGFPDVSDVSDVTGQRVLGMAGVASSSAVSEGE